MTTFHYRSQQLWVEDLPLGEIAQRVGTPCFVYSKQAIVDRFNAHHQALAPLSHRICFAVKANSNIALLQLLASLGSGFDVVSGGELKRVLHIGADPSTIVFSGVAKTTAEIELAVTADIGCINVESEQELQRIAEICGTHNKPARVSIRLNPDIDPQTHPYISTGLRANKFGLAADKAKQLYRDYHNHPLLQFVGLDCHIGSQLTQLRPFVDAVQCLLDFAEGLRHDIGLILSHIDIGGGLGVTYEDEQPPSIDALMQAVKDCWQGHDYHIIIEPGRAIVANAGVLLTQVEYIKPHHEKRFAIVDAAMNDLMRPALYQAWHKILPVHQASTGHSKTYDVVGGICESSDFLGQQRLLNIQQGSVLAVCDVGAYGASMSSNYNSRPKVPEVLVDGANMHLIRQGQSFADMIKNEHLLATTMADSDIS